MVLLDTPVSCVRVIEKTMAFHVKVLVHFIKHYFCESLHGFKPNANNNSTTNNIFYYHTPGWQDNEYMADKHHTAFKLQLLEI